MNIVESPSKSLFLSYSLIFHFCKKKIEKFGSFCAKNLLYAKIQSRDGAAMVMCRFITRFPKSYSYCASLKTSLNLNVDVNKEITRIYG